MAAPNDLLLARCELGIGVDLTSSPDTWAYEDLADPANLVDLPAGAKGRLFDRPIPMTVGRQNLGSRIESTSVTFDLDNSDGWLTPGHPGSPWYPYIDVDLPVRLSVRAGSPYLGLRGASGSRASTANHADLQITGDWWLLVEVWPPILDPPGGFAYEVAGRFNSTGNQRSLLLYLNSVGQLCVRWSTDGTNELDRPSTVVMPRSLFAPMAFGVWLDVNNGAAGHTVHYYAGPSIAEIEADPTSHEFDSVTTAGTTSVHAGNTALDIGDVQGSGFTPFPGRVRRLQLRAGDHTGAVRANPNFGAQQIGATSFSDTAPTPKPWTTTATAPIEAWHGRLVGQIDDIRVLSPHGNVSGTQRVRVTVSGLLRSLEAGYERKVLKSAITRLMSSPRTREFLVAHWPGEDGSEASSVSASTPEVRPMTLKGAFSLAADDRVAGSAPLMVIGSGQVCYQQADIPQIPQVVGVTWEFGRFIRIDDPAVSPADTQIMAVDTNGRVATWRVTINNTQLAITGVDDDGAGVVLATIPQDPAWFDTAAIVVLRVADNGVNVDWRIGVISLSNGGLFNTSGSFVGNTGVPSRFRNNMVGPPSGITVGHTFCTVGTNLAGGLSWLAPADTGFTGERAWARAQRLAAEEGVLFMLEGDPSTSARMGPQGIKPLPDLLQDSADTDGGMLVELRHVLGLGGITRRALLNRATRMNVDMTDPLRGLMTDLEVVSNDAERRNDITAARPNGSEYRALDPNLDLTRDRVYDERIEPVVDSDLALPNQAGWRLFQRNQRRPRIPKLPINLTKALDLQDEFLAMGPGDRVEVANPPAVYVPGTTNLFSHGWEESISPAHWGATLNESPGEAWETGIRNDPARGRRGNRSAVLDADFDAGTDTTMDVDTPTGPLWTQTGPFPLDFEVGGCIIRCTAIGAPSGTVQTFTVSTTVLNGVSKTIPAGTRVRSARPCIRA